MENKAHALAAGLFTVILAAALAATGMWFNKGGTEPVTYVLSPAGSVTGLKTEAPVRYRGVDVGRVTAIRLEPGSTGGVRIEIGVQADTPVTSSTFAQLGYQGVTGIAYVQLGDDGKPAQKLAAQDGKPARIRMKPSFLDDGEQLFATLTGLTDKFNNLFGDANIEKLHDTLASFDQFTRSVGSAAKKLDPALEKLPAVMAETRELAAEARSSLRRMDQIAENADKLMGNASQLALKLDQRMDTLDQVTATARDTGTMVRTLNEESVPRVNALIDDLARETRALDRAVERVVTTVVEQPHGFVFGPPLPRPGPGEPGFNGGK